MNFDKLFEPIKIGSLELKNRIAMAPMNMGYTDPLGYPGDQVLAHYATRARGGFGLLITEAVMINPHEWYGGDTMNVSHLTDYRYYRFWSKVVETVHSYDKCKICIQLSPGWGRQGHPPVSNPSVYPAAPSAVPLHIDLRNVLGNKGWMSQIKKNIKETTGADANFDELLKIPDEVYFSEEFQNNIKKMVMGTSDFLYHNIWREAPREITVEEIKELEGRMAAQAEAAFSIGFDAVEIHSPHGYLLHQFLSPMMNKRVDEYGGTVENRARFLTNIIRKIRAKVGNDRPVWCRLSGDDLSREGFPMKTSARLRLCARRRGSMPSTFPRVVIRLPEAPSRTTGKAISPAGQRGSRTRQVCRPSFPISLHPMNVLRPLRNSQWTSCPSAASP